MILPLECGLRLPLCIAVNWCLRTFNKSQAIVRCRSWLGFYFSKLFFPYTLSVLWKMLQGVAGDRISLTCPTILTLTANRQAMLHYFQNSLCISAFLFSRVRSYHFSCLYINISSFHQYVILVWTICHLCNLMYLCINVLLWYHSGIFELICHIYNRNFAVLAFFQGL